MAARVFDVRAAREVFEDSPRRRKRLVATVALAVVGDFVLFSVFAPEQRNLPLAARIVTFLFATVFWFVVGVYLGRRVWPRHGKRLARYLLARTVTQKAPPLVFLTDRPDFEFSLARRLLEVVGFAAGSVVIVIAILVFTGGGTLAQLVSSGLGILVALWGCFVLVPYWVFGHMGLRRVDGVRWLVVPMSRRYAERLRLTNGALLLLAFGLIFNLSFRAGASGDAAVIDGITTVGHTVASVLVAAATALAFYVHDEHKLIRELEGEAIEMGILDGRGMTDGEFLPRLSEKR
jgi:hypothetical protein